MKKIMVLIGIAIFILAGCSASGEELACSQYESQIGMVTDSGGVNDKSFNQGTWEGINDFCRDYEVGATYIETGDASEMVRNLNTQAEQNEVVVASGYLFENAIYESAKANPDTNYIFIDGEPKDADGNLVEVDNIKSVLFEDSEAGYLVGYLAASLSEANHIGFIGGTEVPPVQRFGWGFVQGAQDANPTVEIEYQYTGTFNDPAKGQTVASAMYDQGVDIIFTCAGGVNDGVVNEAKTRMTNDPENEIWVIGVDRDMYQDGVYQDADGNDQSVILTSAMKNVNVAVYNALEEWKAGTFTGGLVVEDFASGGVGFPEENPNLVDNASIIGESEDALAENGAINGPTSKEVKKEVNTDYINGDL